MVATPTIQGVARFTLRDRQAKGCQVMKVVIGIILLVVLLLQQQLWFGQSGYFERKALAERLAEQQTRTEALALRNAKMTAEVLALKSDTSAFESRARSELGMVKEGEVFYLTPEPEN